MNDAPAARRLFVGIALDEPARAACAAAIDALRRTGLVARFEEVDKLHVTLAFLGNVDVSRSSGVEAAMEAAVRGHAPFEVTLDKIGAFPHERRPRIVYVGAREQGAPFRELAGAVRAEYARLGFSFEDDSVVHVTVARIKEPRRPLPLVDVPPARLAIRELALFESLFDKEANTSRYEVRARAALLG